MRRVYFCRLHTLVLVVSSSKLEFHSLRKAAKICCWVHVSIFISAAVTRALDARRWRQFEPRAGFILLSLFLAGAPFLPQLTGIPLAVLQMVISSLRIFSPSTFLNHAHDIFLSVARANTERGWMWDIMCFCVKRERGGVLTIVEGQFACARWGRGEVGE